MHHSCDTMDTTRSVYRAIVEQAPDALVYADRDGAIRIWNSAAETIFGYSAAEIVGKSLDVIIPERLRSAHWAGFNKAVEAGLLQHAGRVLTTRSVHKDGSKLYVDLSFSLVKDRTGVVIGALAIGRVATERHGPRGV
jgi:PAS domain S-box-containing protein